MRKFLTAVGAIVVLTAMTPSASAVSAPAETAEKATTHCVTLIEKPKPGEREARIVEQTCTTDTQKLAFLQASMDFQSLLVQYFEHPDYQGASNSIYGWGDSCDASGYGIPNTSPFENRISSWYLYGTCDHAMVYKAAGYAGERLGFGGSAITYPRHKDHRGEWTGTDFNDIVRSMWVKDA